MQIVVLDGFTLNPGDLSWEDLKSLGSCDIYDRTPPGEIIARSTNADLLLTNKAELKREHLEQLPQLKYIGILATGTNVVDLAAARERNITVTNVPAYSTKSVAQATIALLLELTNHVGHHSRTVHEGRWEKGPDWCYWDKPLLELDGLTFGIIGFGQIGRAVSNLALALGMRVLIAQHRPKTLPSGISAAPVEEVFRQSDVLSLHCPLTPDTRLLVNAERLSWMKRSAFLLNTSRGLLIEEPALAEALNSGGLAGAGLDVLSSEPPPPNNPLLRTKNCILTPHLAWATKASRSRLMTAAIQNIRAFIAGRQQNVVN
ncbi:MAG TPA: D-2-hydroxyacid dehydrogenase [Candidatus Dormibacteraeota bacterium]|nr:D-2-hydroxyacid dehydrogenase [Candidatus Dormibacteraeota bacterium]